MSSSQVNFPITYSGIMKNTKEKKKLLSLGNCYRLNKQSYKRFIF